MLIIENRARRLGAVVLAIGALLVGACRDTLLEPQQPNTILPGDISSAGPAGAEAIRVGSLGRLQQITAGGGGANQSTVPMLSDALTDVWKSGDTFSQHNETDQRSVQTNNSVLSSAYATLQQSRGFFRDAFEVLKTFVPEKPAEQAEQWWALGFAEIMLGENFCNGIPLGLARNGVVDYTDPSYTPLTNQEVFAKALTHLDTASSLLSGTDASTAAFVTSIKNATAVTRGRLLVDMGKFAEAAAAVAGVPTNFSYNVTFSQTSNDNNIWNLAGQVSTRARFVVGDSFDVTGLIRNALPFSSAKDPRVPTNGSPTATTGTKSIDGVTPLVSQQIWTQRSDPLPVVNGIDARLIEAEAKLQANDIPGMMGILNTLRSSSQSLGPITVAPMAQLPTPATKDAATTLLFREKAFWQFGRGLRLGDLRRLVRQYGRPADQVFPTGTFHKNGGPPYGADVNLPVTDNENTNPNFKGCIDRNA
jgi:hypothetical protein